MDSHNFSHASGLGKFWRQEKSLQGPPNVESLKPWVRSSYAYEKVPLNLQCGEFLILSVYWIMGGQSDSKDPPVRSIVFLFLCN